MTSSNKAMHGRSANGWRCAFSNSLGESSFYLDATRAIGADTTRVCSSSDRALGIVIKFSGPVRRTDAQGRCKMILSELTSVAFMPSFFSLLKHSCT